MATAVGVAACSRCKKVKFFRTAALVNQLSEAKAKGELKRFMRQIEKIDLLICDELCEALHNSSYEKLNIKLLSSTNQVVPVLFPSNISHQVIN